jgi:hypothetical protein
MTGSYCYSGVLCEFLQAPELFTTSLALAIAKAIASAGIEQSQVNFYESLSQVTLDDSKLYCPLGSLWYIF